MNGQDGARGTFRLLFVCTGNICRSPTAEILTRHLLTGRLGGRQAARFVVSSAGVRAVVGGAMHPLARAELAPWGLDGRRSASFAGRQLDLITVEGIDLVLTLTLDHRSAVLEDFPHMLDRTFSLREFSRLCAGVTAPPADLDPVAVAHALVAEARGRRGLVPAGEDDVPDPMGKPPEAHRESTALIFDAVRTMLDLIAPRGSPRAGRLQGSPPISGRPATSLPPTV